MAKTNSKYEFDAALSFAGEDRRLALSLARALQKLGFNIFYDRDHSHHLWGKNRKEYEEVYGPKSRFVIPLISEHYPEKDWTQLELGYALDEAKKRKEEFILPVRVDDTHVLGIHSDRNYLHVRAFSAKQIAKEFAKKCHGKIQHPQSAPVSNSVSASLFSPGVRQISFLLATAVMPLTLKSMMRVFPEMPWKSATSTLRRVGVLGVSDGRLVLQARFRRKLEEGEDDCRQARKTWITALSKLQEYVDLNLHLAIQYLVTGEIKAAVERIVEAVEIGPLGPWAPAYHSCLSTLQGSRFQAKLNADDANRARNALGLSHGLMNRHDEAYRVFVQLVKKCRRRKQPELGNALLNSGVACQNLGHASEAQRWYREAIEYGRKRRDHELVGKALGNLSQSLADDDPVQAAALLGESIIEKRKAGIREERAIEKSQRAALATRRGDYGSASKFYEAAAADELSSGNLLAGAWSLVRAGGSHLDAGNTRKAISAAQRARKIAVDWDADDIAISALTLEARACHENGNTPKFAAAAEALLALTAKEKSADSHICALHALAVARALQKNPRVARRLMQAALSAANCKGSRYWISRCTVDALRQIGPKGYGATRLDGLAKKARERERAKAFGIAGDLWSRHAENSRYEDDFERAAISYRQASKCYSRSKEYENSAEALAYSAESQLRALFFDGAFSTFREAEELALRAGDSDLLAKIIDQRAVYLQELGRYDEAITAHRRAVRAATKAGNRSQLQNSLHNLGEGLRRSGNCTDAAKILKQAEKVARDAHDVASAISSLHCRALAVQGNGHHANARRLFEACKREARRGAVWPEYVDALEALANLAAESGDNAAAERRYTQALAEAKRHQRCESQLRISVNLAALLRSVGRHRRARTLLAKWESQFAGRIDAHIYHAEYAAILDECRDYKKAGIHWLEGLRLARVLGSHEYQQKCLTGLAESHLLQGDCENACRRYEEATSVERDPEHRMDLMSLVFELLLNSDKEREAERIYVKASGFAMKHGLKEAYVDLHLRVFEHDWKGPPTEKANALRAYGIAFLTSIGMDANFIGRVVGEAVWTITNATPPPDDELFQCLIADLEQWLCQQVPKAEWAVEYALQPIRIAAKLMPFAGNPKEVAKHYCRLLENMQKPSRAG